MKKLNIYAWRFSYWKRPIVRLFFSQFNVIFIGKLGDVKPGSSLAIWGSQSLPPSLSEKVQILRLEDGFLRSVGLGADLVS